MLGLAGVCVVRGSNVCSERVHVLLCGDMGFGVGGVGFPVGSQHMGMWWGLPLLGGSGRNSQCRMNVQ
jgi:hypothetical protein